MDFKIEDKSETKKEIVVTITVEEMNSYVESAAKRLSGDMKIKGFRPGHAPKEIIENTIGKEALFEEAAQEAVQETYPKIIEENNLFTLSSPEVDLVKCAPGNDLIYKATVYIMPEIKLPNYKDISSSVLKKEKKDIKVEDKEIDAAIANIQETKASTQQVDREAKKGDAVVINFKGVFNGEEDKKVEEKNFQIVLGRGDMDMLEGFEEKIIGMRATEKKDFSLTLPQKEGGKIDFTLEVVSVLERNLPEISDDFAKSFPNIESLEDLKTKIAEGIKKEKERKQSEVIKIKVLEAIKKETSFEVPEILTEKEIDNMMNTIEGQLVQSGSSLDNYLEEINKKEEELRNEWRKKAEENVAFALILHAVSKAEKIEVTIEEIEGEVDRHFAATGRTKENEKEEDLERMRNYVHDVIKNQKVFGILSIDD